MKEDRQILDEQIQYYRARAPEYEQWFYRHKREWFAELAMLKSFLQDESPGGDILELACGTGLWTRHLVPLAQHITAVDASPETLELNRRRVKSSILEYVEADLFTWRPRQQYDFVFFGFCAFGEIVYDAVPAVDDSVGVGRKGGKDGDVQPFPFGTLHRQF